MGEEFFGSRQFKAIGIEEPISNPKPRNYSGFTTPSEKLENFTKRQKNYLTMVKFVKEF